MSTVEEAWGGQTDEMCAVLCSVAGAMLAQVEYCKGSNVKRLSGPFVHNKTILAMYNLLQFETAEV